MRNARITRMTAPLDNLGFQPSMRHRSSVFVSFSFFHRVHLCVIGVDLIPDVLLSVSWHRTVSMQTHRPVEKVKVLEIGLQKWQCLEIFQQTGRNMALLTTPLGGEKLEASSLSGEEWMFASSMRWTRMPEDRVKTGWSSSGWIS